MNDKLTPEQVDRIKYRASLWMNPGSPIPFEGDAKVVEQLVDDWHRLTAENAAFVEALEEIKIEGSEYMDGPRENDASMGEIIEIALKALEER